MLESVTVHLAIGTSSHAHFLSRVVKKEEKTRLKIRDVSIFKNNYKGKWTALLHPDVLTMEYM